MRTRRYAVVGGGILGAAVAHRILQVEPGSSVTLLEKEQVLARHQTGRNSGVVHAGLYYVPGSLKARLCREGAGLLNDFCAEHGVAYHEIGKVVVALDAAEEARLAGIEERALANGVPGVRRIGPGELRELEPHVTGVAALHSPTTAIVDFPGVTRALARLVEHGGGRVRTGTEVVGLRHVPGGVEVVTRPTADRLRVRAADPDARASDPDGPASDRDTRTAARAAHEVHGQDALEAGVYDTVVVCAGLHADRLSRQLGAPEAPRIMPFRGEYVRLRPTARHLVTGLVYPVPDPRYPFLGVHLTPRVDGEVLVGPNAVLALAREGYRWRDVSPRDLAETLRWPGFLPFARAHWRTGVREVLGSVSRRRFVAAARRYVPELEVRDVIPGPSGVRAQAMDADGSLVDDFRVDVRGAVVALRNAPSPAATSSLAIARHLVEQVRRSPA